ncbi:MAG: hypothetical protein ABJH98_06025 [Reichenbachiella sp.]|uniref:hypothetical protein n=1 Tax=Reichenbachiella sp. TaxID=2184521 RepID=UPI003298F972
MSILISSISIIVLLITLFGIQSYKINLTYSVVLLLIFSFYWISRDGLVSTSDVNLIALFTLLAACNRKKELKLVLICSYIFIVFVVFAWVLDAEFLDVLERHPVFDIYKYQFIVILFTSFMILWLKQYHQDQDSSSKKAEMISSKIQELANENEGLEAQQKELEMSNEQLEQLVQERKEKLTNSNAQISAFLDVNSNQIAPTVEELLEEIESLEGLEKELAYADWLHRSAEKLEEAFVAVKMSHNKWVQEE